MPDQTFSIPENVRKASLRAVQEVRTEPRATFYQRTADAVIQACLKEWGAKYQFGENIAHTAITERRLILSWEPKEMSHE